MYNTMNYDIFPVSIKNFLIGTDVKTSRRGMSKNSKLFKSEAISLNLSTLWKKESKPARTMYRTSISQAANWPNMLMALTRLRCLMMGGVRIPMAIVLLWWNRWTKKMMQQTILVIVRNVPSTIISLMTIVFRTDDSKFPGKDSYICLEIV